MKPPKPPPTFPDTIIVDTREQSPYAFADLHADASAGGGPLTITVERGTLPTGDYSLASLRGLTVVERKSLADLYGTIGQGRARFERELARMQILPLPAAVVVEAEWTDILYRPPTHSQLSPKTIFRSILAWQQRYSHVHWWVVPGRRLGEITTLRFLERVLTDYKKRAATHQPAEADQAITGIFTNNDKERS